MARLFPICSGSTGNSVFIGTRGHGIIVDAGCAFRTLKSSLEIIDTDITQIEAVFITHEHTDHIKGLYQLTKHTKLPVFASPGTIEQLKNPCKTELVFEDARLYDIVHEPYESSDFSVTAFHTPHDSAESVGYKIRYGDKYIAIATDLGKITPEAENAMLGCETVMLESNYDAAMLARNMNYPPDIKRRIAGDYGHLSNAAAAVFAEKLILNGTTRLILGHLSRENNTPALAEKTVSDYLTSRGLRRGRDYILTAAPTMTLGHYISI